MAGVPPQGPPQGPAPFGPPSGPPPAFGAPPTPPPQHGAPQAAKPFDPKVAAYAMAGSALAILISVLSSSWMTGRGGFFGVGPLGLEGRGWTGIDTDIALSGYLCLIGGLAAAAASAYMAFLVLTNTPQKFPKFKLMNGAMGLGAFGTTFFFVRLMIESNRDLSISWGPFFGIGGVIAAGIFMRKLRPYWPGEGNLPWPAIVRAPAASGPGAVPPGGGYPPGQQWGQQPPQQPWGQPPPQPPQQFAPQHAPPQQPQHQPPPQQQPQAATQFCGRCGKPMVFVAQYQRWFCESCQQYQ